MLTQCGSKASGGADRITSGVVGVGNDGRTGSIQEQRSRPLSMTKKFYLDNSPRKTTIIMYIQGMIEMMSNTLLSYLLDKIFKSIKIKNANSKPRNSFLLLSSSFFFPLLAPIFPPYLCPILSSISHNFYSMHLNDLHYYRVRIASCGQERRPIVPRYDSCF